MKAKTIIKIALSVLLLLCLLSMPYGFFNLVRFCALIGFGCLAYIAYHEKKQSLMITFIVLALLFQPFAKIVLGRLLWNVFDVLIAAFLIAIIIKDKEYKLK